MQRFATARHLTGLLALLLAPACGGRADGRPCALLITLDTTNRDALSCYGAPAGLTPNLDRLAAESKLYENARTAAPITAPAHASMLTGLYPLRHSVRMNGMTVLPEAAVTVAERARSAGYRTAAFVAAVVLNAEFGFAQGFETFDQPGEAIEVDPLAPRERTGDQVVDRAVEWLRARDDGAPFFLWVHFFDAHGPYRPPPEFLERAGGDPYLGEVAFVDHQVGRLLDALREEGVLERLLIVVVGDHGEGLGRHGEKTHGTLPFDSTLRVPLLVLDPEGGDAGRRSTDPVSVVDVHPTLIEGLGLGDPGDVDGRSLFRSVPDPGRGVYFESYFGFISFGWSQLCGWADAGGKYVHTSAPVFFDLEADPGEEHDALAELGSGVEPFRAAIARVASRPRLAEVGLGGADGLVAEIEKLGYAGVDAEVEGLPEPLAPSDRPSPLQRVGALRDYVRGSTAADRGEHAKAVELLRAAVEADPTNHTARYELGFSLMQVGEYDEAIAELRRALELRGPNWVAANLNIAACYDNLGRIGSALEYYGRGLEHGAGPEQAIERYLELLERTGRADEAEAFRARVAAAGGVRE